MDKDNTGGAGGYTAIIEALEKENGKLLEENRKLREEFEYVCRHIDKYHELVDKYRKLALQLKGKLAMVENMAEELQKKLEEKTAPTFAEVYYEAVRQVLS